MAGYLRYHPDLFAGLESLLRWVRVLAVSVSVLIVVAGALFFARHEITRVKGDFLHAQHGCKLRRGGRLHRGRGLSSGCFQEMARIKIPQN